MHSIPQYDTLVVSVENGVAVLSVALNRPERYNAVNFQMIQDLNNLFDWLGNMSFSKEDPWSKDPFSRPRVVRLLSSSRGHSAGSDTFFCSGVDIKDADADSKWDFGGLHSQSLMSGLVEKMRALPQVIVCLVEGPAVGLGLALALGADIRIGLAKRASFAIGFTKLGLSGADMGVSYLLPRIVGYSKAAELMLIGDAISAEEAKSCGLLTYLESSRDDLIERGNNVVHKLMSMSPWGLYLTKKQISASMDGATLKSSILAENAIQTYLLSRPEVMKIAREKLKKMSPKL
jgi:enoyl-CoA hydratase